MLSIVKKIYMCVCVQDRVEVLQDDIDEEVEQLDPDEERKEWWGPFEIQRKYTKSTKVFSVQATSNVCCCLQSNEFNVCFCLRSKWLQITQCI